jgi:hypothetical protein
MTTNRFNILKSINTVNTTSSGVNSSFAKYNTSQNTHDNFKTNRFVSKHVNEERNKKQKEDEFIKSLDSLTAFPLLQPIKTEIAINNNSEKSQQITFIEAMKLKNKEDPIENTNSDDVPPGCVCIKYDKLTKKTIWIYGKDTTDINAEKKHIEENEEPILIFQRLVDLHQSRKYDYISKWGIDEYEKIFSYQNYDYEYFDKLDEQMEQAMEKYYQKSTYDSRNYYNDSENDNE